MQATCPICLESCSELLDHVVAEHMERTNQDGSCLFCWCEKPGWPSIRNFAFMQGGKMCWANKEFLQYHLTERGGILTHYLECQLGIYHSVGD